MTTAAGRSPGTAAGDEPAEAMRRLQATIEQQQTVISALVEAAERRLERPADGSAFGRWERNLVLHSEVETRTERISAAERLLRSVVDSLDARLCIVGADGVIVDVNRHWSELSAAMGWADGHAGVGGNLFLLAAEIGPDLGPRLADAVRGVLAGGAASEWSVEGRLVVAGTAEDVILGVHPVHDHDTARAVVTLVDITAATETREQLLEISRQAQLMALAAQHTDDAVVIADAEGRIEWANEMFCRRNGYELEELTGQRRVDLVEGPLTRTPGFRELITALSSGHAADVRFPTPTRSGSTYWAHVQVRPIVDEGRLVRFACVERDVTSERGAEEQLRAATRQAQLLAAELSSEKALLSEVLASIPHLVYWKGPDLRYAGLNQAFLTVRGLAGKQDVLDRLEDEIGADDELSELLLRIEPEVLAGGDAVENQRLVLTVPDLPARTLLLSVLPQTDAEGRVSGVIGVAADITRDSLLEQQLAQATRLESIGQLAAGIAHEINTPVQYVSDNTRFLTETFEEVLAALRAAEAIAAGDGPDAVRLREVLAAVDLEFVAEEIPSALTQSQEGLTRVTQIVRAMKDFSHPGQGRSEADLNRAVESTAQVSRNEWRYVAELELDLDPDVGVVRCHEGELKQVLLNLVVNAAHAIGDEQAKRGDQRPGHIRISTERVPGAVRIRVSDDGPGMEEAVLRKIFDPFFTTKPVGKGTGQGLSMAYGVVQKHGGTLEATSSPGAGAVFTIELPDEVPEG